MQVIESKSILAKCLATENLTVEHQKVPTAMFDLKERKLILPMWKEMSPALYDLLIGHEVGHALETPEEGWHDNVKANPRIKSYLNVLEDARQERITKQRYPGLVKSFYAGYRELFEKDFFGIKGVDLNTLPLIDRINLHFKVGSFLNIQFTPEEQLLVNKVYDLKTWDDVVALGEELFAHGQKEAEEMAEALGYTPQQSEDDEDMDMDFEFGESMSSEGYETPEEETEEQEGQAPVSNGDGELDEEQEQDDGEPQGGEGDISEQIKDWLDNEGAHSITDEAFRENEDKLLSDDGKVNRYFDIPRLPNWKDLIVPAKEMYSGIDNSFSYYIRSLEGHSLEPLANRLVGEFIRDNRSTINQMAQQFEMKRKAQVLNKAKVSKTGDLNENKLWAYKLTEDLFKQSMMIPEGKNHGMLLYLDMSGSMFRNMPGTIDQLITLMMFCRKVNIPFEVYGFTSGGYDNILRKGKMNEMWISDISFRHLGSSLFSKRQMNEVYKHLLMFKYSIEARYTRGATGDYVEVKNKNYTLNGTPLNNSVPFAIEVARKFRKDNNVEIVNSIFLTDGGATDHVESVVNEEQEYPRPTKTYGREERAVYRQGNVSVTAPSNIYCYSGTKDAMAMIELYKQIVGGNVINYFIADQWSSRALENEISEWSNMGWSERHEIITKQRKTGVIVCTATQAFDKRFILKGGANLKIENTSLEVKSNSKGDLLRGFRNFNKDKVQNRVFLSKFMDMVA